MDFIANNLLTLILFIPTAAAVLVLFLPADRRDLIRWTALAASLIPLILSIYAWAAFDRSAPGFQFEVQASWYPAIHSSYHLGVDGVSLPMVLLTALLTPLAILTSFNVQERVKAYMVFFLLLETGMMGVFLALDLVLFYIFWEFTLVPMYFLIGLWGYSRRIYAALKFFIFTMFGSLLMLLAIIFMGLQAGTFNYTDLLAQRELFAGAQLWLFFAFALAFAIKVPMFPLHTWLPDAHVEAPTAGSVILAGIMLKMGAYGFLRYNLPLFPEATLRAAPWLAGLAVVGILYGAATAFAQKDAKRLVAYSSVSHLGFVMLGIFALTQQSVAGGVLQMVNHGLSTGALFLVVGMLYERRHTRDMAAYGGIWKVVPVLGALMLAVVLSSAALPGTNGFVGEFTILLGSFGAPALGTPWFAGLATVGVILAAVYLLHLYERLFLGPLTHEENRQMPDLNLREVLILVPILVMVFWIGLYPQPFLDLINPSVETLLQSVLPAAVAMH